MARRPGNDTISVLEADPDLGEGLSAARLPHARLQARATSRCYPRGRWQVPDDREAALGLGLLVVRGFVVREVTVTPAGVMIDVPLTHDLLASVIGARRPSISAAVRRLVERDRIRPRPRSRWLLLGGPPRLP